MTIKQSLNNAINILKQAKIKEPARIAKIILADLLGKTKEYILINENEVMTNEIYNVYIKRIEEVTKGTPIQYITNKQEFMGMEFFVNKNVLIPRPDTEILVEEILEIIKQSNNLSIIDMCTGSGAIAISIAKYTDSNKIYAVDISDKALKVAKKNAIKNGVDEKIKFIKSNMFENIETEERFDIIVSNPPYIETKVIETLEIQVQKEPRIALDGGMDGLDFYRSLLINSKKYLKPTGVIVMEIGYNQKEAVINLFRKDYECIYCKKDLSGNDRVIVCKNIFKEKK